MGLTWYCWGNNYEHCRLQHGVVLTCFCAHQACRNHTAAASHLWRTIANFLLSTHGKVLVNRSSKRWWSRFLQHRGKCRPSCFISVHQAFCLGRVDLHQWPREEEGVQLFLYSRFHFVSLSETRRSGAGVGQSHPGGLQGNFCRWTKCVKIFSAYSLGGIASGWRTKRC